MIRLDDRSAAFAREIHAAGRLGVSVASDWESKAARELMARGFVYPGVATASEKIDKSSPKSADYCVVIPVLDRAKQLAELLNLVRIHDGGVAEIIVVDDGSENAAEIAEVATAFGARLVGLPSNKGPGAARNAGAHIASKPFIAFLDSDCMPTAMWVEQRLRVLVALQALGDRVEVIHGEECGVRLAAIIGMVDGAGHLPTAFAQNWLHLWQYAEICLYIFKLPLAFQGGHQTLQIP